MTWLELYNFLYENANNIKTAGKFNWQDHVNVYDVSTGESYACDTLNWKISDRHNYCLSINSEAEET